MRGHGHDRARAVAREHVVGNEDRQRLAVDGVDARDACQPDAGLFLVELRALEVALRRGLLLVGRHLVGIFEHARLQPLLHERVLRAHDHVRRAEERIAAGGINGNDILHRPGCGAARGPVRSSGDGRTAFGHNFKVHQRARGLADPVALHLLDALGPVERVEILQEPLGVFGDLQHPLAHRPADDGMVAALRFAVDDLLVREHRAERGAPVDRHFRDVGEPLLVKLLENPLRPPVVLRIGRVDLAVPVVGEAERANLLAEAVDVLLRRDRGMRARFDRVLLGGEPERVPAHRVQDVEALHPLVAAEDVRRRVALGVPHVEARARRIREHVKAVELRPVAAVLRPEGLVLQPELLPLLLDGRKIIVAHYCFVAPSACSAIAFSISPDTSLVAAATPACTA